MSATAHDELIAELGDRRCTECGRVHDAYWNRPGVRSGRFSWASPEDGHPYRSESWPEVAKRYGWSPDAEREQFPPVPPKDTP